MQGVAEQLGVSRVAVSSVLNGRARQRGYSQKMVEKVQAHLEQCGYVPSRHAIELRGGGVSRTGILHCGYLYSHLVEAFNLLVDCMMTEKEFLEPMMVREEQLLSGLQELIARRVSKLVWFRTGIGRNTVGMEAFLPYLRQFERVVIYNFGFGDEADEELLLAADVHLVGVNRFEGWKLLGGLLHKLGHRVVALPEHHADSSKWGPSSTIVRSLTMFGMKLFGCNSGVVSGQRTPQYARSLVDSLLALRRHHPITAACFGDDENAAHFMRELLDRGIRIPEDLTVTGYDGMRFASALAVPLTTLAVPVEAMVSQVIRLLKGEGVQCRRCCHPFTLVERRSHGLAAT